MISRIAAEGSVDGVGDGDGEASVRGVEQGGSGGLVEDCRGRKDVRKEEERMSERESGV